MKNSTLEEFLLAKADTKKDTTLVPGYTAYRLKLEPAVMNSVNGAAPMRDVFALIKENSKPLQLSLRCEPALSRHLQEEYETVMPADNMNKRYWIKVLITGQLPEEEIKDLINLSYSLTQSNI